MDEVVQRAIRELRRSGATWPEVVETLVAEFPDEPNLLGLANIALRKHKEAVDKKNPCPKCGHAMEWHENGIICHAPSVQPEVSVDSWGYRQNTLYPHPMCNECYRMLPSSAWGPPIDENTCRHGYTNGNCPLAGGGECDS